jgi:hypothetical protein
LAPEQTASGERAAYEIAVRLNDRYISAML